MMLDFDEVMLAIDAESEAPGEMPDAMWNAIRNDRDAATRLCQITVMLSKHGIRERIITISERRRRDDE